jgi:two-component system sensor histidine kinase EvgS
MNALMHTTLTRYCAFRAPIDPASFREIWNVDPHEHRALLGEYADTNSGDIAALKAAVARHNRPGILQAAHRIAGASQIVGALRVVACCRRMEHAARELAWPDISQALDRLCGEIELVDAYIGSI